MLWSEKSDRKKAALQHLIPPEWQLSASRIADAETCTDVSGLISSELSLNERSITESSVKDILHSISTGDMTAYEVMSAFCHRAALAHQLVKLIYHESHKVHIRLM